MIFLVVEYATHEELDDFRKLRKELGFKNVANGLMVMTSQKLENSLLSI